MPKQSAATQIRAKRRSRRADPCSDGTRSASSVSERIDALSSQLQSVAEVVSRLTQERLAPNVAESKSSVPAAAPADGLLSASAAASALNPELVIAHCMPRPSLVERLRTGAFIDFGVVLYCLKHGGDMERAVSTEEVFAEFDVHPLFMPARPKRLEVASAVDFARVMTCLIGRLMDASTPSDRSVVADLHKYADRIFAYTEEFEWSVVREFDERRRRSVAFRADRTSPPSYSAPPKLTESIQILAHRPRDRRD